jgi:putative nucleotidyltransferase with HDIG domain
MSELGEFAETGSAIEGGPYVPDLKSTQRREMQLDAISALLVLAMGTLLGLLMYFLSANDVQLPTSILADYAPRILLGGFVIMLLLYLADQRRRLRDKVAQSVAETETARAKLHAANDWLSFSHHAASILGSEGIEEGLNQILTDAAGLFHADATAVIGDDNEWSHVASGATTEEAQRTIMHVAMVAAGHSAPLHIQSLGTEPGQAIAVPLRVEGELRYVLCVWRRDQDFAGDELEALGLLGRMVELAIEREELLKEAQVQLEGTLQVLQYLVANKRPDYSRHAMSVANLAAEIGAKMGLSSAERKDMRLAGLVHDVGMMSLPRDLADAGRPLTPEQLAVIKEHPRIGEEIAVAANFSPHVQEAVRNHHERIDGSGYAGLRGDQVSIEARILAVCEVFDTMTHRDYYGGPSTLQDAVTELHQNAGVLYDPDVVKALLAHLNSKVASAALDLGPELEPEARPLLENAAPATDSLSYVSTSVTWS